MIQNLSIRVPWTDNGWCGKVCNRPCQNNDCLRLKNIYENKNEDEEESLAGQSMRGLEGKLPCIAEGVAFMSSEELIRSIIHPYAKPDSPTHSHFLPTIEHFVPYSLPARPFLWTMKDAVDFEKYGIDYQSSREPKLDFFNNWVQEAENQKAIFEKFYGNVVPNKSLVIPYAKQVPFVDDPRRVVIGIGFVTEVIPAVPHECSKDKPLRSMTWETIVCHSIRENGENGFLMPYYQLMKYAAENPKFDIKKATVFGSDDYRQEFSYATEHISYDAIINTLLQCIDAFNYISQFNELAACIPCVKRINWCEARLKEMWDYRGAYPGLGEMLYMFNVKKGLMIADEIQNHIRETQEPLLQCLDDLFAKKATYVSKEYIDSIDEIVFDSWKGLASNPERKKLFALLSRFNLYVPKDRKNRYEYLFNPEMREKIRKGWDDKDILENPYTIYENTIHCDDDLKVPVHFVDAAIFPNTQIQEKYPVEKPSRLDSGNDKRRIRALLISLLEEQSDNGNSFYPWGMAIERVSAMPLDPPCKITTDMVSGCLDFIQEKIVCVDITIDDGGEINRKAFQLKRLHKMNALIESKVYKRVFDAKPHVIRENWEEILNKGLGEVADDDEEEKKARLEKSQVLRELAQARLSVLIGGAGTGKTTLLSILCSIPSICQGGVLLLAPTGKARVKMMTAMSERGVKATAKTVAQFLLPSEHFVYSTMKYRLRNKTAENVPATVIIDESSMLTEEMFAALLEALADAQRIIFVGDPNQLPPIGTGRPFVDLVCNLSKDIPLSRFPRVGKSFGELKTTRRQKDASEKIRDDIEFAKWFKSNSEDLDDDIFVRLEQNTANNHIVLKKWTTNAELEEAIFESLKEELCLDSVDDVVNFNLSLGSTQPNAKYKSQYFNVGCAKCAENWQILAPVKNMPYGVLNLNHLIQKKYRGAFTELANQKWRKIPNRMGPESIVYGDKVICVKNDRDRKAYPSKPDNLDFVANGEIGIAMAAWGITKFLNVEYSSQPGVTYGYPVGNASDENESILELAYALTVHKSQGSEFKKVILVINEPCNLLSRELLYTAVTRQVDKLVILYNADAFHLRDYSSAKYSEIAKRFTRLFRIPSIAKVDDKFYSDYLVYRTKRGELVRSKSEVIIANLLFDNKIRYKYEEPLDVGGNKKRPDFTIKDKESGKEWYWEHCGMMSDYKYRKKWEDKKRLYNANGYVEGKNLIVTEEWEGDSGLEKIYSIIDMLKKELGIEKTDEDDVYDFDD